MSRVNKALHTKIDRFTDDIDRLTYLYDNVIEIPCCNGCICGRKSVTVSMAATKMEDLLNQSFGNVD